MEREPRGIEKLIQDAQKEGKFDDLEHKGEPLRVAFGDLASVANDVMRDSGVVPEWIELGRAIEVLRERQAELIAGLDQRRSADRAELDAALEALRAGAQSAPPSEIRNPKSEIRRRAWARLLQFFWSGEPSAPEHGAAKAAAIVARMEKDRRRTLTQLAEQVRTEQKRVDRFNLVLPVGGRQMHRVRIEERLQEFQHRFPTLALAGADGDWQLHEHVESLDPALLTDREESPTPRSGRPGQQIEALGRMRAIHRKPPPIG